MEKVGSVIVSPWKVQAVTVPDQKSGRLTRCSQRSTALQHDQSSAKQSPSKNLHFHYIAAACVLLKLSTTGRSHAEKKEIQATQPQ
jgi:hypothetical protein